MEAMAIGLKEVFDPVEIFRDDLEQSYKLKAVFQFDSDSIFCSDLSAFSLMCSSM